MYRAAGCPLCGNTGYKGRIGIYELLEFDEQICAAIQRGAPIEEIRGLARGVGFRTMQEDAVDKVRQGWTSLDEVLRLVPFDTSAGARCCTCSRDSSPGFPYCPFCGTPRTSGVQQSAPLPPDPKPSKRSRA
jgi:bacterioferritin-associated ferredoxin